MSLDNNSNTFPIKAYVALSKIGDAAVNFGRTVKNVVEYTALALAILVGAVASPVLGLLGAICFSGKAAYDGCLLFYHWRHSAKEKDGELISDTELFRADSVGDPEYRDKDANYVPADIKRLEHEVNRLYYQNALDNDLKWARGLSKCILPWAGLIWAIQTEREEDGCLAFSGSDNDNVQPEITNERWLEYQIKKLKGKKPSPPTPF